MTNFSLVLMFFFSGTAAVVYCLTIEKPQWLGGYELIDLAIGGFIACGVIGLIFFLRSLKIKNGV